MELLEGTTLAHEVGKGPLQITRAIDIAVQMRMRSERSWQILTTTPTRIWWVADSSRMSSRRFLYGVQFPFQHSAPDTPDGNSHFLLALGLTMESLSVLPEVVKRGAA
jgi:hypothetical protein